MAHITRTRQVDLVRRSSAGELLPPDLELNNFAVFCGSASMRTELAANAIARYAGRVGIVVLLNNAGTMVDYLEQIPVRLNRPQLQVMADRQKRYDPLYGMSADVIVNLLAPKDPLNPLQQGVNALRSALLAYLRIMDYQFSQGRGPFGDHPYNLNLLMQLTAMDYDQLERRVLRHMPQHIAGPIISQLNAAGMQQEVYSCVDSFASTMQEYLWQQADFQDHTRRSMIDAVTRGQIICLRVPHSHAPLLNYIDAELQVLSNRNIPFLLVNCGVDISAHPAMQSWFLDAHRDRGYYTAIVADSISHVTLDADQRSKLFSQYRQVFVFQCFSDEQAEPFCAQFGQYYREERERHVDQHRQPFHLFPSHQVGVTHRQVEEMNIRPNELRQLGNGLLLCGNAYQRPCLIRHFDNTGGIFNGVLLP